MYVFSPDDVRLLREYRDVPSRHHSLDLQRLLTRLRTEPLQGKQFILVTKPGKEWAIGQLGQRRGDPVTIVENRRYTSFKAVQMALLKLRWLKHSGLPWPAELDA